MGKIVCFHGCDFKTGTTMISRCIAEQLSKDDSKPRVLLLHLGNRESMSYAKNDGGCIDDLHNSLKSGVFTTSHLLAACSRRHNLYTLAGLREFFIPEDVKYMPDMSIQLLRTVRNDFGYIVIDAGNNIFWGLTMGALLTSDQNYLLIRQNETYLKRFEEIMPHYTKLGRRERDVTIRISFNKIIINQYKSSGLHDEEYITKRLALVNPMVIPYHEQAECAEIDEKSLLAYKDKNFEKAVKRLAGHIEGEAEPDKERKNSVKRGSRFFVTKAGEGVRTDTM